MVTSRLRWLAGRRPAVMGRPQPAQGAKVRDVRPHSNRVQPPPPLSPGSRRGGGDTRNCTSNYYKDSFAVVMGRGIGNMARVFKTS